MKAEMLQSIERRFADVEEKEVIVLATIIDPRFKDKFFSGAVNCQNAKNSDKYNYFQVCGQDVRPTNKVVGHSLLHVYATWSMFIHA